MLKRTSATAGIHKDLTVSDVDKMHRLALFSKAPAKIFFLHMWRARGKSVPSCPLRDNEWVTASLYQALIQQNVLSWISASYPDGN
jgi:hypothetical protein